MTKQPEINGLEELERSDGYLIHKIYHSVVLYKLTTNVRKIAYVLVVFRGAWQYSKDYWYIVELRTYKMGHYARLKFKKTRYDLMKQELGIE